jgi:hypothetical protein
MRLTAIASSDGLTDCTTRNQCRIKWLIEGGAKTKRRTVGLGLPKQTKLQVNSLMKIANGWRRIDNDRGFLNETTGQTLVVTKKQYGEHYLLLLFPEAKDSEGGKKVSPEFQTKAKAEAFTLDWMSKHPKRRK